MPRPISYAVFCSKKKNKHTNQCGVGRAATLLEAWNLTYATDKQAPFGGIIVFFNDTATTEIYTLSLHDALPISAFLLIDIQITLKQMLRDFIGIRVNRAKKSGKIGRAVQQECRDRYRMPSS